MRIPSETFQTYIDADGETFFCPLSALEDSRGVPAGILDECVEASTVGRYAGNLDFSDERPS